MRNSTSGKRVGAGGPGRASAAGGACADLMVRRARAGRPDLPTDHPENHCERPIAQIEKNRARQKSFLSGPEIYGLRSFEVIVFSSGLYVRL